MTATCHLFLYQKKGMLSKDGGYVGSKLANPPLFVLAVEQEVSNTGLSAKAFSEVSGKPMEYKEKE